MLKKINTRVLLLAFVVLGGLLLITVFRDSEGHEKTFRDEFYKIDSSQVKTILLYPQKINHQEIRLVNVSGNQWEVQNKITNSDADTAAVQSLIKTLVHMKPVRLAGNDKESWKEFDVTDSAGTRIKGLDPSQKTVIDLVVGKFSYNQQSRSGVTYVRVNGDDKVYAVDGFLSPMLNQEFDRWRNKNVLIGNKANWTKLIFHYPADSGFILHKTSAWMVDDEKCDSAKTEHYLNGITHLQGYKYLDKFDAKTGRELFSLSVEGNNGMVPVTVKAYLNSDTTDKYVLNSSLNPKAYFSGTSGNLFKTIFPDKKSVLK